MDSRTDFRNFIGELKRKYQENQVPEDGKPATVASVPITIEELRISHFPERYKDASFDGYLFYGTDAQKAAQRRLVECLRRGLPVVMYGNNGTGKTHLAYASMRNQILQGKEAVYASLTDIIEEIKQGFGNNVPTSRILDKYICYDYLVIDEMDKAYGSPTEFLNIFKIVNGRYMAKLPTVLISNASKEDVMEIVGKSSFERIGEDGIAVHMDWPSFRIRSVAREAGKEDR